MRLPFGIRLFQTSQAGKKQPARPIIRSLGRVLDGRDKAFLIPFELLSLGPNANDAEAIDAIFHGNGIDDILPGHHIAKNAMLAIQMRCRSMSDEELAAIGAWSCIGHGKRASLIMLQTGMELILEFITGSPSAIAFRIAALNHEIGDDPMEFKSIIKRFTGWLIGLFCSFR